MQSAVLDDRYAKLAVPVVAPRNEKLATGNFFNRFLPSQGSIPPEYKKYSHESDCIFYGAGGGNRTHTPSQAPDFESGLATITTLRHI